MARTSSQQSSVSHKRRKGSRKKRSFITTTYRVPKWQKNLQAGVKKFKHQAWNVLGLLGLIVALFWIARLVMGGG